MKKQIQRQERARWRRAVVRFLSAYLFFVMCLSGRLALANMPVPKEAPDYYLAGVNKIIVWANAPMDAEVTENLIRQHKIPQLDFKTLNRSIADQLRAALPRDLKDKVMIETVLDTPMAKGGKNEDENALIVSFTFGFHIDRIGDKEFILGAVYPTIQRLPPKPLIADRVSGLHRSFNGQPPAPFLMEGDQEAVMRSASQATLRCVSIVATWLSGMPTEIKK